MLKYDKNRYTLKEETQLILFVTEPPCGDASLQSVEGKLHWTGAKPIQKNRDLKVDVELGT